MARGARTVLRLLLAAAGLAALAWTVGRLGPAEVARAARDADPLWLVLSIAPIVARFVIWGLKWHRMLCRRERVPLALAQRVLMAGCFVNLTTPTAKLGGGVLRALVLRRERGWPAAAAWGWALADQVATALGFLLLYGVLATGAAALGPGMPARASLGASGLAALALVGVALGLRRAAWTRVVRGPGRLSRFVPRALRGAGEGRGPGPEVLGPLLHEGQGRFTLAGDVVLSALSFAALCLANAMALRSLGVTTPLWQIFPAVVLGYAAGTGLGPWGGIGVTEAALAGLFVGLGIPAGTAAAGALLHRAGYYLVVLAWGGTALLRTRRPGPERVSPISRG